MVDRVKIYLTSSLITKQNLVVVSDTVHMNVGGPKSLGETGTPSTFDGGVADPREHASPSPALLCQFRSFWVEPFERNYEHLPQHYMTPHAPPFKVTPGHWK